MAFPRLTTEQLQAKLAKVERDITEREDRLAAWSKKDIRIIKDFGGIPERWVQNRDGLWINMEITETALRCLREDLKKIAAELRRRERAAA